MKGLEKLINKLAGELCPSEAELSQEIVPCDKFKEGTSPEETLVMCKKCWNESLEKEVN